MEEPGSKNLPGNPFAKYAEAHMDTALAVLALAWEVRTRTMLDHTLVGHEETVERLKELK